MIGGTTPEGEGADASDLRRDANASIPSET